MSLVSFSIGIAYDKDIGPTCDKKSKEAPIEDLNLNSLSEV